MTPRSGRKPSLTEPSAPLGSDPVAKSTFARMIGCDKSRITVWCQTGTLNGPAVTMAGRIVPSIGVAQLIASGSMRARSNAATPDPRRAGAADSPDEGISTYDRSRAVLEDLRVQRAQLDLAERRSELVPRALADTILFDAARALRNSWITWPARVVATMAVSLGIDPARLLAELERAVKAQLTEVADPTADWRGRSAVRLQGGLV